MTAMRHDIRRGAVLILASTLLFSLMAVAVKLLGSRLPFMEIVFFRSFFALPVVVVLAMRGSATLRTRRLPGHLGRACTGLMASCCMFFSATVLPLGEQQALTYSTPIFVTLLAIPVLGERPGPHRWAAVVLGFLGILVIALGPGLMGQPHAPPPGVAEWVLLAGYAAASLHGFFAAGTTLLVRQLSSTETSASIVLWQSLLMTVLSALALPFVWVTPTPGEWLLLLVMGLVGGIAQLLSTEAFASAQVSSLGPYTYTALLWAALFGWIFWGDVPGPTMVLGAAMIVAAGLYILQREMRRRPGRGAAAVAPQGAAAASGQGD
ncbi:DMT family transporter [Roseomonas marmotae]|uniref:DMT family transporter n=1 Tax=Roseomonas marmotae TaxID=2768161 RepID=A0ABS3K9P0_9PROT|nr:DMT family transporter [Roseomonas marmotae]MBO1074184.1 DMT family transporter [Roseomonas marmotae]QTI78958.1 DMT family transporter [Roseomonas marmotae]